MFDPQTALMVAFASLTLLAALGFIRFSQPVHAALSFAVTVLSGAGLYLMANSPYAAMATVIVYAGATIIIFLFALMFAQRPVPQAYESGMIRVAVPMLVAVSLVAILIYCVSGFRNAAPAGPAAVDAAAYADAAASTGQTTKVADLGRAMYTRYIWAVELAGALLLVAALGAIRIAREDVSDDPPQEGCRP